MRIVLWQDMYRIPKPTTCNGKPAGDVLVYGVTEDDVSRVNVDKPYQDSDHIYCINIPHLSRFEIGRMIDLLGIPISRRNIFPLYMPKNGSLDDVSIPISFF